MSGVCADDPTIASNMKSCSTAVNSAFSAIDPRLPDLVKQMMDSSPDEPAPAPKKKKSTYDKEKKEFYSKLETLSDLHQTNLLLNETNIQRNSILDKPDILDTANDELLNVENKINMNKRKSFYEHQETALQLNIIRFLFILYWIVFVIYVCIVIAVGYSPAQKNLVRISIVILLIMPFLTNRLVPIFGGWFFSLWNKLPKNIYTEL